MASEKVAARYSFLCFSVSGAARSPALRDSHASSEVSPRASASTCFHTRSAERLRHSHLLDYGVSHVDVELKCDRELIVHQAGGNEHALRIAQLEIAMADGVVAEGNVVAVGDHGFVALVHRERDKVISLALQSGRSRVRDGGDHSLQIRSATVTSPEMA